LQKSMMPDGIKCLGEIQGNNDDIWISREKLRDCMENI